MKLLLKPLQWLYCLYAFVWFLVLMVPVFIFALAASFFGRIRGGNLIYKACRMWVRMWFPLVFIRHKNIFEQRPNGRQSYIFVVNHISYLDAAIIIRTFRKPLRPLGKVEMGNVPFFGFIYKKAIVSVDRSSAENRAKSVQILKSILRKGISILVFPEGTFNLSRRPLKEFYDGAFRIAIETGTPIKPVLFLDAFDRMHYKSIFTLSPGSNRSVFLEEVDTSRYTIGDVALLRDHVYNLMDAKLRQYQASWIEK